MPTFRSIFNPLWASAFFSRNLLRRSPNGGKLRIDQRNCSRSYGSRSSERDGTSP